MEGGVLKITLSGSYQQVFRLIVKATLQGNGIIVSYCGEYITAAFVE
jgi:hypothetical protein